jgi:hypothetical protein
MRRERLLPAQLPSLNGAAPDRRVHAPREKAWHEHNVTKATPDGLDLVSNEEAHTWLRRRRPEVGEQRDCPLGGAGSHARGA